MNKIEIIKDFLRVRGYDIRRFKGYDLNDKNIVSKALTKQEALEAIELYRQLQTPILGGDVLCLNEKTGEIHWKYDNWYYEPRENETNIEYLNRSIDKAENYIRNYNNNLSENCIALFDIVYEKNALN